VDDTPLRAGREVPVPRRIAGQNLKMSESARKSGAKGPVVAELLVERDGTVSDVHFLGEVPILSVEVLRLVKGWAFEPTLKDGKPVRVLLTMSFSFSP
jgi:protein TonB